jgi:lycopene cyclase domain-containing protein
MKAEYLFFNIVVFSGPFFLALLKPFRFKHWSEALFSIIIVMIPYVVWDAIVTGMHWVFNTNYVLGIYLVRLPVEEWFFFITVPFACLFTWEMIIRRIDRNISSVFKYIRYTLYAFPLLGVIIFNLGLQYTGLVFIFLGLAGLLDRMIKTDLLLQKRFYLYLFFIVAFTLVFNGYLTWRPVVLYDANYQLGLRVFTIPIEDFGYGISLLYLNTMIYERLKHKKLQPALNTI